MVCVILVVYAEFRTIKSIWESRRRNHREQIIWTKSQSVYQHGVNWYWHGKNLECFNKVAGDECEILVSARYCGHKNANPGGRVLGRACLNPYLCSFCSISSEHHSPSPVLAHILVLSGFRCNTFIQSSFTTQLHMVTILFLFFWIILTSCIVTSL